MTDPRAYDVPRTAVDFAFQEAVSDCALLRLRHVTTRGCGGACSVDALLVFAHGVLEHWWEPQLSACDLDEALRILHAIGGRR